MCRCVRRRTYFQLLLLLLVLLVSAQAQQSCLKLNSPLTESMLLTPECTLSVTALNCERRIKRVDFGARYFQAGSENATVTAIGSVTKAPYILPWDISQIPNQLYSGATVFADVTFSNDNVESLRNDGIFFIHQTITRPVFDVPYDYSGTQQLPKKVIELTDGRSNVRIRNHVYWNEKELSFLVSVNDPAFSTKNLSREQLSSMGAEILIDPLKSRKPFPGPDVYIFSVPLHGKPYRIAYNKEQNDSIGFKLTATTAVCEFRNEVVKEDGKGFTIYFTVPVALFGDRLPETIGCNIVLKTLNPRNQVIRTSWVPASKFETYSPYLWGELHIELKSVFMNRWLIGILFFGAGFLVTLMVASVILMITRPNIKKTAAQSEADRQQFLLIKPEFDAKVTLRNITLDQIAKAVTMPPAKLSLLVKRATGMTFSEYVTFARIEIAKERLRSSHANEEAIAEACGFASVNDMEKQFVRFCRVTPAKFRSEQQVA